MAANIPAKLKPADISRFALRATQVEKVKPAISYWCYYHVVNQILAKGLHTEDDECMAYTTNLMDKLETIKVENVGNDAIADDVAAKAYAEQFALETFDRAENAVRANKASAQTADTYRAAATFLDLMSVWGAPEQEIAAKSKYAKYHALRIAKAIRAGEDPNLSNPVRQPEPAEERPPLDPSDPEVQLIDGGSLQPTVEDALESGRPSPAFSAPQAPPAVPTFQPAPPEAHSARGDLSPLESPSNPRAGSIGGGYFPTVPTFTSETAASSLPTAPPDVPDIPTAPSDQPMHSADEIMDAQDFYHTQTPSAHASVTSPQLSVPHTNMRPGAYNVDEESMAIAQKHARWAISALNFEDVDTAVKELKIALDTLGAR